MNKLYLLELYIMNRPDLGVLGSIRRNLKGSLRLHNLHRLDIYCSYPGTIYIIHTYEGLSIYYVSSYNKAGSFRMLTNAYLREQGFIQKLMSYENPHKLKI